MPSQSTNCYARSSGVLCHITSLAPSRNSTDAPEGVAADWLVGDLGPTSREFVDFLAAAGQTWWQMLPLGPPALNDSPYSCYSAMAGNLVMISLADLVNDGLLSESELPAVQSGDHPTDVIDHQLALQQKQQGLKASFDRFMTTKPASLWQQYQVFVDKQSCWLEDFARYEALMLHFGEINWTRWPDDLPKRDPEILKDWDQRLASEIEFSKFGQFIFDLQWYRLKQYASGKAVKLCGDMPIFVAHESADVWAHQNLFSLDASGSPKLIAGVPPDYFSKTGQLWGNPLYDWKANEQSDFHWWVQRLARAFSQFDLLRVDHFRGFEAYWEVPAGAKTAVAGRWVKGPAEKPFRAAEAKLGELPVIAEDLGMITEAVYELRDLLGYPGMRVMQFGFDQLEEDFHRPSAYPAHSVAYTGTHDNDTVMGWYNQRKKETTFCELISPLIRGDDPIHLQLIQAVFDSNSEIAIVPVQDLLGLGNEARMNRPGKAKGNWAWRLSSGMLTTELADQIRSITQTTNRLPDDIG